MDYKTRTRRIKTVAWSAFVIPFITIGASLNIRQAKAKSFDDSRNYKYVCGSPAPRAPYPYTGYAASNIDYYEQPKFVLDYFRNLTENMQTNNVGNCGYTALIMLLSYYDTYWNKLIIPDQYNNPWETDLDSLSDRYYSSPGVIDLFYPVWTQANPEPDPENPGYDEAVRKAYHVYVYDKMLPLADVNLISKLYEIALNENKNIVRNFKVWDFDHDPKPSIDMHGLYDLSRFFFEEFGLSQKVSLEDVWASEFVDYDDEYERLEMMRREMIERIKQGQPVIVGGPLSPGGDDMDPNSNPNSYNGHIAIAYGYDERHDQIIGHMGWKGTDLNEISLDKLFKYIDAYAYLDVKDDLEFSYPNIRFKTPSVGLCCAHDLDTHLHGERAMVPYSDNEYHALQCVCGDVTYERHSFTVTPYDGLRHIHECQCGFTELEPHHFVLRGMMRFECKDCGFSMPAGHIPNLIYNP